MPVSFGWYDEHKSIWMVEFQGRWTVDEFWQAMDSSNQVADALAPRPIYLISRVHGILNMPKGIISAIQSASSQTRPNERMHVIIGGGMIVRWFYNLRHLFTPQEDLRVADTLEEALALIERTIAEDAALRQSQS